MIPHRLVECVGFLALLAAGNEHPFASPPGRPRFAGSYQHLSDTTAPRALGDDDEYQLGHSIVGMKDGQELDVRNAGHAVVIDGGEDFASGIPFETLQTLGDLFRGSWIAEFGEERSDRGRVGERYGANVGRHADIVANREASGYFSRTILRVRRSPPTSST